MKTFVLRDVLDFLYLDKESTKNKGRPSNLFSFIWIQG